MGAAGAVRHLLWYCEHVAFAAGCNRIAIISNDNEKEEVVLVCSFNGITSYIKGSGESLVGI
jgi:hypothetical protein